MSRGNEDDVSAFKKQMQLLTVIRHGILGMYELFRNDDSLLKIISPETIYTPAK